ncbi:MAG: NifB/NifX family molybdenum-iron cluster-binding protein [Desulfobacteraceae bacterium]|nr:NifB/NifX family molybdenum-iron cluster-binding protein [Desulfobacteraceae bacterium]
MKVAVSSSGKDLDSQIDPRFGRCAYFLIVDTQDMNLTVFENENMALGGGAGISSGQFLVSKGVRAVLTGNCGPNAVRVLSAAGVELFVGQAGTVRQALERYKNGELRPATEANVADHYGMGGTGSIGDVGVQAEGGRTGMGRGMGRGRCMGGGRGMGRGMGISGGDVPNQMDFGSLPKQEELKVIKEQAGALTKQLEEIEARIKKLEGTD